MEIPAKIIGVTDLQTNIDNGVMLMDSWLASANWEVDTKRNVKGAKFLRLADPGPSAASSRTVWKMLMTMPVHMDKIFHAWTENMQQIIPPGTSYKTLEQAYPYKEESDEKHGNIRVQRTITTSFVGGLVKEREYIDAMQHTRNTEYAKLPAHRLDAIGLAEPAWPATGNLGHVRGINHHVALICTESEAHGPESTDLTYVVQTAANGWIPGWAVDSALVDEHFLPLVRNLSRYFEVEITD
eukprot:m.88514 g.88514  ORF g.88514 m.88514 type:complete len:241 (+) comp13169_c1_seq3:762-1484(+)